MKRSGIFHLIVLTMAFAGVITFGGCSLFQKPDGTTVTAPSPAKLEAAAAAASTGAGIFGGPIGQAVGAGAAAVLLALAAHYRGKEVGWVEKTNEDKGATVKV